MRTNTKNTGNGSTKRRTLWFESLEDRRMLSVAMLIDGGAAMTNHRDVEVLFSDVAADAEDMRFAFNGKRGDWQPFAAAATVQLPNWQGTNWVAAEIEYADGRVVTAFDSINYIKPTLQLDNGAVVTNDRSVSATFSDIAPGAENVRFAFNGKRGDWQPFAAAATVQLPNWRGTNWVAAEIEYADGHVVTAFDSINYIKPTLQLDNGAVVTNDRSVSATFSDIAPGAENVRFAFNGKRGDWQPFAAAATVQLPNWRGTNWVAAEIEYADGHVVTAFDSINYIKPTLQLDNGAVVTNDRSVSATFSDIAPGAENVRFAFNGKIGDWQAFATAVTVQLPNWEGINWVAAEIRCADGHVVTAFDSIDYVKPILVSAGTENITFVLNIRDSAGEGFRDPGLGDDRVTAFTYALGIWSGALQASYAGEAIHVDATMDRLPDQNPNDNMKPIGAAWPLWSAYGSENDIPKTIYMGALANHLGGLDWNTESAEIVAVFSNETNWYYGTDGVAGSDIDFVTTVLHEIGHGLIFYDTILGDGEWANDSPGIYDRYLQDATGTPLTDMTASQRAGAITSGELYWNGAAAKAVNGGTMPRLYAPDSYEPGSSVLHLDETVHGDELMSPIQSGPDHTLSNLELAILTDIGWDLFTTAGGLSLQSGMAGFAQLVGPSADLLFANPAEQQRSMTCQRVIAVDLTMLSDVDWLEVSDPWTPWQPTLMGSAQLRDPIADALFVNLAKQGKMARHHASAAELVFAEASPTRSSQMDQPSEMVSAKRPLRMLPTSSGISDMQIRTPEWHSWKRWGGEGR